MTWVRSIQSIRSAGVILKKFVPLLYDREGHKSMRQ
jgi:hypothetical protein